MDRQFTSKYLPVDVPVQQVGYSTIDREYRFRVLRLDLIHPVVGGNKCFKLLENVRKFQAGGFAGILSFGGAYSNHIAALADFGHRLGIPTYGIIRGEARSVTNPTLSRAGRLGMMLEFVGRDEYRRYRDTDTSAVLQSRYGHVLIVPEGGSNVDGVTGCRQIARYIPGDSTDVILAVGTGATLTGIRQALPSKIRIWGLKVLEAKQETRWDSEVSGPVEWDGRFTHGGYAKTSTELLQFTDDWNRQTGIPIEPVYTGKLLFGVIRLMDEGRIPAGPETIVIHTGGLQYLHD